MSTDDAFGAPGRWAVVRELTAVCLDLVAGGVFDDAAIAVGAPDQAPLVLASTSARARTMLEWESVCGEGAAWEAWRVRGAASIRDLTDPVVGRHWPAYAAGASERGVLAAAAVPLSVGSAVLGVLAGFADAAGRVRCRRPRSPRRRRRTRHHHGARRLLDGRGRVGRRGRRRRRPGARPCPPGGGHARRPLRGVDRRRAGAAAGSIVRRGRRSRRRGRRRGRWARRRRA